MENFSFINDSSTRRFVKNGFNAVTQLQLWSWLKTFEPEPDQGFMFSSNSNISEIGKKMHELPDSPGHSGSSFAFTMRQLHYIAKNGMDKYKKFHETD